MPRAHGSEAGPAGSVLQTLTATLSELTREGSRGTESRVPQIPNPGENWSVLIVYK